MCIARYCYSKSSVRLSVRDVDVPAFSIWTIHIRGLYVTVLKRYMHLAFCEIMDWAKRVYSVFQAVVVAKLMYASPAWIGFTTATDHNRVDAFFVTGQGYRFCSPDLLPYDELLENADDKLFTNICWNPAHVLRSLLPTTSVASQHYGLRQRKHCIKLPMHAYWSPYRF